jgi:Ca-activated chloride channel family protein
MYGDTIAKEKEMSSYYGWKPKVSGIVIVAALAMFAVGVPAQAKQVQIDVAMGTPVMKADEKQTAYLKVGLTGFEMAGKGDRTPVNVALVLDRSGSMQGDKIERAKEAALMAVDRLGAQDILSVIAYQSTVDVLLPATKVADKQSIREAIRSIGAGGNTALFGGVSKGAFEARKFLDDNRVNRIVLLSDGLANVGPSSPSALGELGESLSKEGISVSTIGLGLGFNEDLMTQLAYKSDGNHAFVENSADLVGIFDKEFGDILSVVAQEVTVRIECAEGIRPIRLLGREGDISGQIVTTQLNQLYSNQEKYVMLEVEVPATGAGETRKVAGVEVTYSNMDTQAGDKLSQVVSVDFTESEEVVEAKIDKDVMIGCILQIGNETNEKAVALRDQGKVEEAREVLITNNYFLESNALRYDSDALQQEAVSQTLDAQSLEGQDWAKQRKEMKFRAFTNKTQQSYKE